MGKKRKTLVIKLKKIKKINIFHGLYKRLKQKPLIFCLCGNGIPLGELVK